MIIKHTLLSTTLTAFLLTSTAYGDVEDDIFKSGVENAIKVMEYQKKLSLSDTDRDGRFCYKLNPKDGEVAIDDFWIIKLEALSLIATTDPLYFEDKKGKKTLCFFTAKSKEAYKAKKKLIEDKFENILKFKPQQIVLKQKEGIIPIVPRLGKWNNDMSDTIKILNKQIAKVKAESKECKQSLDKVMSVIQNIPKEVGKVVDQDRGDDLSLGQEATEKQPKHTEKKSAMNSKKEERPVKKQQKHDRKKHLI